MLAACFLTAPSFCTVAQWLAYLAHDLALVLGIKYLWADNVFFWVPILSKQCPAAVQSQYYV